MKHLKLITAIIGVFLLAYCAPPNRPDAKKPVMPDGGIAPSYKTNADGNLELSWDSVSEASSYELEYSLSEDSGYVLADSGSTSLSILYGLNPGVDYYLRIRARNSLGVSDYCDPFVIHILAPVKPSFIDSISYNKLMGSWLFLSSNTAKAKLADILRFRKDYMIGHISEDGSLGATSLTLLDSNRIRGSWSALQETGFEWEYALSADGQTLVITYPGDDDTNPIELTYAKSDRRGLGCNLWFDPIDNPDLPYIPLSDYRETEDSRIYYFDSGTDRSSLIPTVVLSEGSLISPNPKLCNLNGTAEFTITDGTDSVTLKMKGEDRPADNMLANGDFSKGIEGWNWFVTDDVAVDGNGYWNDGEFVLDVTATAVQSWANWTCSVEYRSNQSPGFIVLEAGKTYRIQFTAYADRDRTMNVVIAENARDLNGDDNFFTPYVDEELNVSTSAQVFNYDFTMPLTDNLPHLLFECGTDTGAVHLDNIKLVPLG